MCSYVHHHNIHTRALQVSLVIMAIGLGAYQANIIQFGLDQLQDASTAEITSFIAWYTWTTTSACFTVEAVFTCLSETTKNFWICLYKRYTDLDFIDLLQSLANQRASESGSFHIGIQSAQVCCQNQASTTQKCLHLL